MIKKSTMTRYQKFYSFIGFTLVLYLFATGVFVHYEWTRNTFKMYRCAIAWDSNASGKEVVFPDYCSDMGFSGYPLK